MTDHDRPGRREWTVEAIYDGHVLRLLQPLDLEPGTVVRISVTPLEPSQPQPGFLETALGLQLQGPPDWSERADEYRLMAAEEERENEARRRAEETVRGGTDQAE